MTIVMLKDISQECLEYDEDTRPWHIWLDILQLGKTGVGSEFTLDELAAVNGMPIDYYEDSLDELLADYYITIKD
jgi:hypothetical protein